MENYRAECAEVKSWNGTSAQPTCTDLCKRWIYELQAHPISGSIRCCMCDQRSRNDRMECLRTRRNIVTVCNISLDNSDECQRNSRECNETRRRENSVATRGRKLQIIHLHDDVLSCKLYSC